MTPEQFQTLQQSVLEAVREALRGLQNSADRAQSPWRDREGAAAYLHCSCSYIDQKHASGELPGQYLGTSPRFRVEDLDALLTDRKAKSPTV